MVLGGQHLAPAERPFAWLGSHKPSAAAATIVAALPPGFAVQHELQCMQVRMPKLRQQTACKRVTLYSNVQLPADLFADPQPTEQILD